MLREHAMLVAAHSVALAEYEARMFQNYLELIVSLHKDSWLPWDWHQIAAAPAPPPTYEAERAATWALQSYQPSISDRLTGREPFVRVELQQSVLRARQHDAAAHAEQMAQWNWFRNVAHGVINGDLNAYLTVAEEFMPFDELESIGTVVRLHSESPEFVQAFVTVRNQDVVPREEIKLLASGKLSSKEMPKSKYWALYQDHVCSAALRVGREVFALLPVRTVVVHVGAGTIDRATGREIIETMLSVSFDRERFYALNFDRLDPSEAVSSFEHRMKFKKTSGFTAVEPLSPTPGATLVGR